MWGPSHLGKNFATQPSPLILYSWHLWNVLSVTLSPTLYWISSPHFELAIAAWVIFARSKLTLVSATLFCIFDMIASADDPVEHSSAGRVVGIIGEIRQGEHPRHRWKPEYPVEALMAFIMQNHIWGRTQTQPFWLHWTWKWIDWLIILFVCSLVPSVWGWYTDDIFSLTPVNFASTFHKHDMKGLSLSETQLSSKPFSQYQLLKTRSTMFSAVASVHVDMIHTLEPNLSVIDKIQL